MHILKPRLSEKSYATSKATNTFVIDVPSELNKHEVAAAVEKQFEVKVASVRTVNRKGKTKRVMNTTGKRYTNRQGVQSGIKKAYVTLVPGDSLPFFEAIEADEAQAAKVTEQVAKASEKAEKKEAKKDAKAKKTSKKEEKK